MSKIRYEIFGNIGELSECERDWGDITFSFVGADATHFSVFGHSFAVINSSVTVPKEKISDGIHIPRLMTQGGQVLLPLIEIDGRKITFPEPDGISHTLSLRIARINAKLTSLEKNLCDLEKYVKGSSCF